MTTTEPRRAAFCDSRAAGSISKERYLSAEFARVELERVWLQVWQAACLETEIPAVGDYHEYRIGDRSAIVVRAAPDRIRAFQNVCLHRGTKLKEGCGNAASLRCPYHYWTWDLDGQIQSIPERGDFTGLADCDLRLGEVRVDTYAGWVFVNFDLEAEPLDVYLEEIPDLLAPYHLEGQHCWRAWSRDVPANWKNTFDAFNESYHLSFTHPQTMPCTGGPDGDVELFGTHSREITPFGIPSSYLGYEPEVDEVLDCMGDTMEQLGEDLMVTFLGPLKAMEPPPGESTAERVRGLLNGNIRTIAGVVGLNLDDIPDDQLIDAYQVTLFPNLLFTCFAFGYWAFRVRPLNGNPERCRLDWFQFHALPGGEVAPSPAAPVHFAEDASWGQIMDQDLSNIGRQQQGMHNDRFSNLNLGRFEQRIRRQHEVIDRYLARPE